MPPSGSQTDIAMNVSPWYPPRQVSSLVLAGRPRERQYCRHIFTATSTLTEPESHRKTCSSPSGASSASRSARATAGSWVSPPNITWLIRDELVAGGGVERRVRVPVDRRPPGRHAVDQLTAVGQPQPHPVGRLDDERRWRAGHRPVRMPDPPPVDLEQVLDHPRRVLGLSPGLGPPAPLPRFSRMRMLTLIGLPAKPKSSRSRRSMNRR